MPVCKDIVVGKTGTIRKTGEKEEQMEKDTLVQLAEQHLEAYIDDLRALVNIDSGTYTKAGVDRVGVYLQERFHDFGFSTYFDSHTDYGNQLVAVRKGDEPNGKRILLVGHMDTVFPAGEAQRRPFTLSQREGRRIATGPGVLDMKSGVLIGLYGLHLLQHMQEEHYQRVTCICNSDEEIGSPISTLLIQEIARQSDAVIVLEPGRALENVISSRKSCGIYRVEVHGVAAHAGAEPGKGRNAILELAHQVQALQALNGTVPDASLCVSVIHGGERTNVVPDVAYCEIDVRASTLESARAMEAAMQRVTEQHVLDGTSITLSGGMRNPPFERSGRNAHLVQYAKEVGAELGLTIREISSGGASDANYTSALGIPTIDGLGAGGGMAHNPEEYVEIDDVPLRLALLAGLVNKIA